MEEKERYELTDTDCILDTERNIVVSDVFDVIANADIITDLLNKQDKRIKELEQENQQLKQQLHELPKKIVGDIEKNFTEYLPLKYKTGAGFYSRLNTILKKYGGEDESKRFI